MTPAEWQLDVAPTAREVHEAMLLAGRNSLRGSGLVWAIVEGIFFGFCAAIGAAMMLLIIVQMAGGPGNDALPVAVLPLTVVGFGAFSHWLMRRRHLIIARSSVASRFGRMQQVDIGAGGITLRTAHSKWHSGWGDVVAVRGGKTCICIAISGIALALPHRAFANPPDLNHALQMMQAWQREAV